MSTTSHHHHHHHSQQQYHPSDNTSTTGATTSSEAHYVILPPPTALNPLPSLPAALRLDNKEQFMNCLLTHPTNVEQAVFRQVLVFPNETLRVLLMRQVLSDPHDDNVKNTGGSSSGTTKKSTKANWDTLGSFPSLPKALQTNLVATQLLNDEPAQQQQKVDHHQHVDVTTYLLRPWDVEATQQVARRIHSASKNKNNKPQQHQHQHVDRLVFLPQPTAMMTQLLQDVGLSSAANSVVIQSLQLDLFPIESDVISMEYDTALLEAVGVPMPPLTTTTTTTSTTTAAHTSSSHHDATSLQQPSPSTGGGGVPVVTTTTTANTHMGVGPGSGGGGGGVEGTPSSFVTTCARSLLKLQDIVGTIPRLQSIGMLGEQVTAKMLSLQLDEYLLVSSNNDNNNNTTTTMNDENVKPTPVPTSSSSNNNNGLVMMLMDRKVDMVTPMVTPLTYEGLLDEVIGIDCGFIKVDLDTINPDDNEEKKRDDDKTTTTKKKSKEVVLLGVHAGDSLYAEVRDQHVEKFGSFLQNQALALKESHANFTSKQTKKDLQQIHQFVKQIPIFTQNLRSLTNHIHLAERIKAETENKTTFREQWQTERSIMEGELCYDVLEEWIASGYQPVWKVLRLICLQSLCAGGLKSSKYEAFRAMMVQSYGYEFMVIWHRLEQAGWIKRKDNTLFLDNAITGGGGYGSAKWWSTVRRLLILIHAEVNTTDPDDVSYVSSGYAPLSVRLVQSAMQGWKSSPGKEEVLKELLQQAGGGRLVDVLQYDPPQDIHGTLKHQQQYPPFPTKPTTTSGGNTTSTTTTTDPSSLGHYATILTGGGGGVLTSVKKKKPTLFVVFLGGITFTEIAALRFLSQRPNFPYHIIMITTKVWNGSKLLQSLA